MKTFPALDIFRRTVPQENAAWVKNHHEETYMAIVDDAFERFLYQMILRMKNVLKNVEVSFWIFTLIGNNGLVI